MATLALAGCGANGERDRQEQSAAPDSATLTAKLEAKLEGEFTKKYAGAQELGAARLGYSDFEADPDVKFEVSCIDRGTKAYSCVVSKYSTVSGPSAPTPEQPNRRRESEESFEALMDPATGEVQYSDPTSY